MESNILYSKEGFIFSKNKINSYSLSFQMNNENINLSKIIDFNLIKLIYDLNTDIYEKVTFSQINENEAILFLLMKHLFEELGLPQRYNHLHMKKFVSNNNIKFISKTIDIEKPFDLPSEARLMPIDNMVCNCEIPDGNPHKINCTCNVEFSSSMNVPQVAEKMVGLILFKIFKRVKQFIENVRI